MTSPAPAAAAVDFRALAEAFWQDYLRQSPTFATRIGDRRYDDRLEDISGPARNARVASLRATIEAAVALEADDLEPVDRVSRSMLIEEATGQLLALETRVDEWSVNPLDGPQTWVVDIVDDQTIETVEDGRRLVARARAVGVYMDQAIDALRRGMARGCVASVAPLERVIEEVHLLVDVPAESWRLATPASHEHAGWGAGDLARFRTDLLDAIERVVIPAFGRYLDVLEQEILSVARPSDRAGLLHVPDGEAIYRALARSHTGLDIEPRTVHEVGLREIERIDEAFADLGARVLGVHGLEATLAALQSNPAFRFGSSDEVFETAARTVARAEAAVPAWFGRLPGVSCEVWRIPEESAAHQTLAYYAWPTLDGTRPGRYYINLHAPETRPRYEAEALAFHEAVPGHHLQMALAAELRDLPTFQRILGSNAFAEGWALYTERLADEMGLYSSDMDRFGILSFDAWRASRLVVDTGLHAMGWTRDQAIAFMREHTALDDGNIANEVDRYIAWPGQALAYKLGQLEILRLRATAEAVLGDRFDIRAFHDTVLGSGAVGMATLAGIVEGWIAQHGAPIPAIPASS